MSAYKTLLVLATAATVTWGAALVGAAESRESLWAETIPPKTDAQIQWLRAEGREVLGLFQPALGQPEGAVLILHGRGEHADWPSVIQPLRVALPEHGWSTFSLQMPSLEIGADTGAYAEQTQAAQSRIAAALEWLTANSQGPVIIVARGISGNWATAYLTSQQNPAVAGIVFLGVQHYPQHDALALDARLASLQTNLLDIVGNVDDPAVHRSAEKRLKLSRLANDAQTQPPFRSVAVGLGTSNYQQRIIYGADHDFIGFEPQLVRWIRGWLKRRVENG